MLKIKPSLFVGIDFKPTWARNKGSIKNEPEDFIVQEITPDGQVLGDHSQLESETGLFTHVILKKRGIDTFSARDILLDHVRRKNIFVSENDIKFAGLKDAQAITYQRGSLWNIKPKQLDDFWNERIKILSAASGLYEVVPGDLAGNRFQINVRSSKIDSNLLRSIIEQIKNVFVPNFFMLQRFGSLRPVLHKVGRSFLEKDYKSAVLGYLCVTSSIEQDNIFESRLALAENGLKGVSSFLKTTPRKYFYERRLASFLQGSWKHPNYQRALYSLPRYFLDLTISAFQSYLFNRILSKLLKKRKESLIDEVIPLPGWDYRKKQHVQDETINEAVYETLFEEKIDEEFYYKVKKSKKFKTRFRKAMVIPENLQLECDYNEFNLDFRLPKGCYATAVIHQFVDIEPEIKMLIPESVNWE
ncbi:MAG: tRNA pseudouridine(13) synthase TruD [Candidatus Hodarchaeales archaeon]|jgi:tRNA pseudouridine13 synthase